MEKTLGGDRLGSGKKMKVHLHNYERSTHDLSRAWRSTMSAGTLVPFMVELGLPGDTFDIELDANIMTHPTIGPMLGSFKIQLDVFLAPIRLYQAVLHNNKLGVGLAMNKVMFPIINLSSSDTAPLDQDLNPIQINPSCLLAYLGIRGVGQTTTGTPQLRSFNAIPLCMYWEIYKNYYANKQEGIGAVIHNDTPQGGSVTAASVVRTSGGPAIIPAAPAESVFALSNTLAVQIQVGYPSGSRPNAENVLINLSGRYWSLAELGASDDPTNTRWVVEVKDWMRQYSTINYKVGSLTDVITVPPKVVTFDLENIDTLRESILGQSIITPFNLSVSAAYAPYNLVLGETGGWPHKKNTQEGLGLKTYQSDIFNNWLSSEWIEGVNGINTITAIDTSSGSFTLDALMLSRKVFDLLNRIAVSGGSYDDWVDAVWSHERYRRVESPIYLGGLSKELVFDEVVSQSAGAGQPLGTLAGRGKMAGKHKGGYIHVSVDEPSYIMGIISLTPRIDYNQGNKWHVHLRTMDDLHKPALDGIGFQDLMTETMAWWDVYYDSATLQWVRRSAGKQPSWLDYMTSYNETYGNFAIANNEGWMVLNRQYDYEIGPNGWFRIKDLTTYIDPSKFNRIFAETSLDAMNFWAQVGIGMTARRKMSAKIMPNL